MSIGARHLMKIKKRAWWVYRMPGEYLYMSVLTQ